MAGVFYLALSTSKNPNAWRYNGRMVIRSFQCGDTPDSFVGRRTQGNHLEPLKGDRAGQISIRINEQCRVCFVWTAEGPTDVEIVDYH